METRITKDVEEAIALLKEGEVVAFPTETVYGLGGSIVCPEAVQKIFSVKGRPADNPLIAHVFSMQQAADLAENPPEAFFLLAERFWPGPLTLVVRKRPTVSSAISAGQPTIALRMPRHRIAQKILKGVGQPLAAPSANLSGRPSPTRASEVWEDLAGRIPLIVDGGPCWIGIESTVVSLIHSMPTILRPGQITQGELEEALGGKVAIATGGPIVSPGMKYRHYAPNAKVRLVLQEEELKGSFILSRRPVRGKTTHPLLAKTLYRLLRRADHLGVAEVEIYCDTVTQLDGALMDRLLRAAHS